jgi:hypothetical protein
MGVKLLSRRQLCKVGFNLKPGYFRRLIDDHGAIFRHGGGVAK